MEAHQVTLKFRMELIIALWRLLHGAAGAHHRTMEAQFCTIKVHPGGLEGHQSAVDDTMAPKTRNVAVETHHGAMEAYRTAMEANHGAKEAHHGAV